MVILAVTLVYFLGVGGMWLNGQYWSLHNEMYFSTMLLIAASCLALNKTWSNLLAAILCGQLPAAFFYDIWMLAKNAEIHIFSSSHIHMVMRDLAEIEWQPLLWCALSIIMLSFSVTSITRAAERRTLP
jgi:hypothetical protein